MSTTTTNDGESKEEMETRHKKEAKALDGEKRAALKKAKTVKGKKGKDALTSAEAEYDEKTKEMEQRHQRELAELIKTTEMLDLTAHVESESNQVRFALADKSLTVESSSSSAVAVVPATTKENDEAAEERQRKLEKARRKRDKMKEKERRRDEEIAADTAAAGPTPRDIETFQLMKILKPLNLTIRDVPADGNCLYRAVAAQLSNNNNNNNNEDPTGRATISYQQVRAMCATSLEQRADELAPFCEYTDQVPDYPTYVERVRSSDDWGGHLELRALAAALAPRSIHVYSANQTEGPLVIGSDSGGKFDSDKNPPIRLSYHLHYYSLGEHYNQVVPTKTDGSEP